MAYAKCYYNKKYGASGGATHETLNLAIGRGSNSQTVVNMAKFPDAFAGKGLWRRREPEIAHLGASRKQLLTLNAQPGTQ